MQSIVELLSKMRVEDLISDIKDGHTCVFMKPRGAKVLVSNASGLSITNKSGRSISTLDLITSDLYVAPYMHANKIKSMLKPNEEYEIIYSYISDKIYLSSIKADGVYINDYRTMHHRTQLYNLEMPIIEDLTMNNLLALIRAPEIHFTRLRLTKIADAVMFLNAEYQATLNNPYREKSQASPAYNRLVKAIFDTRPLSLAQDLNQRFMELLDWTKKAKDVAAVPNIRAFNIPNHAITIQNFTLTFLPSELTKYLNASKINVVAFRTILMILSGRGFNKNLADAKIVNEVKEMGMKLNWNI